MYYNDETELWVISLQVRHIKRDKLYRKHCELSNFRNGLSVSLLVRICAFDSWQKKGKEKKERKRESKQTQLSGFELALVRQLLASRAWNFTRKPRKRKKRYVLSLNWLRSRSRDPPSGKEILLARFQIQIKVKKWSSSCKYFLRKKIKAEVIVTFQNIFSSMADFRDVVSVLPCN